jgi:hypothetical protein
LVPDLASTPQQQLRFRELTTRAFACADVGCESRLLRVNRAIIDAVRAADAVGGAMQNVWASLLAPTRSERLAMWTSVGDALVSAYYFDTSATAWPSGIAPLPMQVKKLVDLAEHTSGDPTNELIDRLSRPMYCDEMLYLRRGLWARRPDPRRRLSVRFAETLRQCRTLASAP